MKEKCVEEEKLQQPSDLLSGAICTVIYESTLEEERDGGE
jgi:hypothetical protein